MQIHRLPHSTTQRLPDLASRVVSADPALGGFYRPFENKPDAAHVQQQKRRFTVQQRLTLKEVLTAQYQHISNAPTNQFDSLLSSKTFTITTGHQLNLFTGPLYFLYKIIDVIKIANQWNALQDGNTYVPVYWMASEDHDFEEINHFSVNGQSINWSREQQGSVGRLSTEGLGQVLKVWKQHLGDRPHAEELQNLFAKSYVEHSNLADATRFLVHQLFGNYGLVIVDGDDPQLKQEFIPYIKRECEEQLIQKGSETTVEKLNDALQTKIKVQVNPRNINLFYMGELSRKRIEKTATGYLVADTEILFSKQELIEEINSHPNRFSPNALFRPIYQELILPNLVTVVGGSELAYWLQLSEVFATFDLPMPMLKLRSSVLLISDKQKRKLNKLDVSVADLFLPTNELINHQVRKISNIDIDLGQFKAYLDQQFIPLYAIAKQTDSSFLGAVQAQEKKQKKGIDRLEKRLLKAQRKKLVDHVNRLTELQQQLFPMGDLQERRTNFAEFVLKFGDDFIPFLMKHIDPNEKDFMCFSM
jgi:bacillithiol biosynthesis cysteine-adding enzyme BshC